MYAFPQIHIPKKAVDHAIVSKIIFVNQHIKIPQLIYLFKLLYFKKNNIEPDMFYCLQLLEATGICVVPGSGFHQKPNTYHFRTTILPPVDQIKSLLSKFEEFHKSFIQQWS